jgi:Glycosyl transferase family 11.
MIKTISFSQLGKYGRLGNQLFQIAGVMGMAEKYKAQAAFPEWSYQPYFETLLPRGEMQSSQVTERYFHHYDWALTGDSDLLGYLQSEKYFGSFRFKLKDEFVHLCQARAGLLDFFQDETICIHIRRGDYVNNENYYQLKPEFYIDALITHFPHWRNCNILFISDDPEYCRVHFGCLPNAHFSKGFSDIEDMAFASGCDHFIISNSSFAWWCAYLGEKPHTKIIHCGQLHAGRLAKKGHRDYYPDRWIEHKKESYKIPLRDVTFTIPVYYDHQYRKENLDLSAYFLLSSFDTNIIITEQGAGMFDYVSAWSKYIRAEYPDFHRTRMLNDMCNLADTAYIVNWDCDVILPPMQILLAVEELRSGADMVFPYGGEFARMPRAWFPVIQKALDIGVVRDEPFKGREPNHNSVGGAVMFNRESFYDGGMENENMVSFGPEDSERNDRFKMLGYDVQRVGGTLFHLNHYVGPNSSPKNKHFADNHKELEKVRAMDRQTLREYVDSWPWRHPYTSRYYHQISDGSIRSARLVLEALGWMPESVIDIGCGVGEWNNGHPDYTGVDFRINKKDLLIPAENFISCDLNNTYLEPGRKYDLALCLEVAEHLRPNRAEGLIKMLCSLSDRVLFSAAIPYQGGTGHINERFQTYWAGLFAEHGFGAAEIQPAIRDCPDIEFWYRQNIILYERGARGVVCDFVLPDYYLQIVRSRNGTK